MKAFSLRLLLAFSALVLFAGESLCLAQDAARNLQSAREQSQETKELKIGVATLLSGDFSLLGQNVVATLETYNKHFARHKFNFVYEDSKLSSKDGLSAYQKLIQVDAVDMIICGSTSNGTIAAKTIINTSKTPTISIVTGGRNIDLAGPYIFRIGNSDVLNGQQEADEFLKQGIKKVALIVEGTEYTQDIATSFEARYQKSAGQIVYKSEFSPGVNDFRAEITLIKKKEAEGLFIPTQTGTALGIFVKQWSEQGGKAVPIHTTFVAAPNPDARQIAGDAINGVYYMAPEYDAVSTRLAQFVELYRHDHGKEPPIMFHSAAVVDSMDLLQEYLDREGSYSRDGFKDYLLHSVKNYHGLMGVYSFDEEGNANLGFKLARIPAP